MEKKYQIFISSTYKDLIVERNIAINTIIKMGHLPMGSEFFSASGDSLLEYIKSMISLSDYVLLIIGDRYGSKAENGISYIEEEYNYALIENKKIIVFIKSEQSQERELIKFINKVLERQTVCYWDNQTDFSVKLSSALYNVFTNEPSATYWTRRNRFEDKKNEKDTDKLDKYFLEIKNTLGLTNVKEEEANILGLMAMNLREIKEFYTLTKDQAIKSYNLAKNTSIVGIILMIVAIIILLIPENNQVALITAIGGIIVELLAGTSLFVYKSSLKQLNYYYESLHNNERFLSLVNIAGKTQIKDELYNKIIESELKNLEIQDSSQLW